MDHKPWRWRRKSTEKTMTASGRASLSLERNVVEDQDNETGSLKCPSNLSDRLPSVMCDCSAKEELIKKHRRIAEQALAGQEMERAEAAYLRQELDQALQQGEAAEKRLAHLNAELKDCMREMESLRAQQDERLQNEISQAKVDFEKEHKKLEAKLAEANKRMSNLSAENANLMKALICKERLLHDLDKGKSELESELDLVTGKLDSAEKENTLLQYEFRVVTKEVQLRNEEKRHCQRSAMENGKQISKLEAECQQLRHLVRKRLQVHVQGTEQANMRRKKLNPTMANPSEKPAKGASFLIERVYSLEEENMALREILAISDSELQSWIIKYGKLASRLAELEVQLQELTRGENSMQLAISGFGLSNCDGYGDSESWESALSTELEQFRQGNIKTQLECKAIEVAGFIDDVEMEKFAIVSTGTAVLGSGNDLQYRKTDILPVAAGNSYCKNIDEPFRQQSSWLDEILHVILEEHRVSKRNLGELVEDITIALGQNGNSISNHKGGSSSEICGFLTWETSESTCTENQTQGRPNNLTSIDDKKILDVKDASFAQEKIRKSFGTDRSKSELDVRSASRHNTLAQMIAIQSTMQEENRRMKEKLQKATQEKVALKSELKEAKQKITVLLKEQETLAESKGLTEDQIENQRLINEDLSTQLTVAKAKLNEVLHKLSSMEVELDHRYNCCEELETTCLELQLQLETISRKDSPYTDIDQVVRKLLDHAHCPNPTTAITVYQAPASDTKSTPVQRASLRDRMLAEEDYQTEHLELSRAEENVSEGNLEKPSVHHAEHKALPAPKPKSPDQVDIVALVPSKRSGGGFGFMRKLFQRRKKGCTKMNVVPLQRNASALMKQRNLVLLV